MLNRVPEFDKILKIDKYRGRQFKIAKTVQHPEGHL
jgi:hypothetical protein